MAKSQKNIKVEIKPVWVIWGLLAVIAGMLALWRPWQTNISGRSVSVSGESTIKAQPDEYVFNPSFELTGGDQEELTQEITDLTEEVISALKALGVEDKDIKLNAYGGNNHYYLYPSDREGEHRITANLTVTADSREDAQTIQDYLATTPATGQLTPAIQFSEEQQMELEAQARKQAIADARSKAEQSASLLDASLGKVLEVNETNGFDTFPVARTAELQAEESDGGLPVQPGQNDYTYSVEVKFEIR